jgi:hypothetical protein
MRLSVCALVQFATRFQQDVFASPSFFLSDNILQYSTLKIKIVFAHLKMVKFKFIVNLKFALSLPYCIVISSRNINGFHM